MSRNIRRFVYFAVLVLWSGIGTAGQTPTATATLRGRVTQAGSGVPLPRVKLTLAGSSRSPLVSVTDANGDYVFDDVPDGTFTLSADRTGFLSAQYGQTRPLGAGRSLQVHDHQPLDHVDIRLYRAASIAGRIVDDLGEATAGVRVEAVPTRKIGRGAAAIPIASTSTDDLGEYYLSGLNPGSYVVRATTSETFVADEPTQGSFAYAPTFYPGGADPTLATVITLAAGDALPHVDLQLTVARTARLSGRVEQTQGNGAASGVTVSLSRIARDGTGAVISIGGAGNVITGQDWRFVFKDIAPGEYALSTRLDGGETVRRRVELSGQDLADIVLRPRPDSPVSGSIVTDESSPPPFAFATLRVLPIPAKDNVLAATDLVAAQPVDRDGGFRIADLDGAYRFTVSGIAAGWRIKRIAADNRDVTDQTFEVSDGRPAPRLQIILTRSSASVSGRVTDGQRAGIPFMTVVAFATEPGKWDTLGRFVRAGQTDSAGRFVLAGLPSGDYYIATTDAFGDDAWEDSAVLQTLAKAAQRIELHEGRTSEIEFVVGDVP